MSGGDGGRGGGANGRGSGDEELEPLGGYDEAYAEDGRPRPPYAGLLGALAEADLAALRRRVERSAADVGATFGGEPFGIDPVPRILRAGEWDELAAGLAQRLRALNAFVADAYGERRIVAAGVLPERVIEQAEGYEPELRGRLPEGAAPIGVAGLDVVRDERGALLVLEDNLRMPSGFAYAVAAQEAVAEALPYAGEPRWELAAGVAPALARALRAAAPGNDGAAPFGAAGAPRGATDLPGAANGTADLRGAANGTAGAAGAAPDDPFVVLLSDGPSAATWFEHATAARWLGIPVVEIGDLRRRGRDVVARLPDGSERRVDVVYRRCDGERLQDDAGRPTAVAELLLEPWLAGRVGVVNAFGAGVADDKLAHAHVERMVRFYLGEEPLLRSVPSLDLADPEVVAQLAADPRRYVIKPRAGEGGRGVVICAHASDDDVREALAQVRAEPEAWIAQETIALSHHPTVVGDGLEPRHIDLRPFVFCTRGSQTPVPGGLTRVAWEAGALVVNSSQQGGAKDTWVLRD